MRKLLIFFGAACVIVLLSAGSTYLIFSRLNADPVSTDHANASQRIISYLERITTNLADSGISRFIQVGLEIWVGDDVTLRFFQQNMAEVRSRLIGILRSKTSADLEGSEGMEKLSAEIADALHAVYPEGSILGVHFTEFLIQ